MKSHSKFVFHIFIPFALLTSLLGSALTVTPVHAAGITVTTTADELNADGDCSLREAIQSANTDLAADTCTAGSGADIITLPAGTYTLTITGAGEDLNATGDLDITDSLTLNGASAGSTVIRAGATPGSGIDRVFHVIAAIPVSISNVTIANGKCTSCNGGGILNNGGTLTVTNSTFSGNSAPNFYGGGIYNGNILSVTNSTFSGNSAQYGGGIYNNGTLTITNSTFSGDSAPGGGGIYNDNDGTLTVTNSAFSNNSATIGGGIQNDGSLTVTNSTFSGNSASSGGGISNYGTLHLKNTILANSSGSGTDCYNSSGNTIATDTNNLIEANGISGNRCGTPAVTADPSLGALADNGGPTQTFAITNTSSAYNAGDNATCEAADQRGVARPQNGTCDIGAFELNAQSGPTFDVNTIEESLDGSCDAFAAGVTDCTLREAISAANNLAGANTLNVPAGTYTLTMVGAGEDANATGDLDITGSLAINGASAGTTVIQAGATPGSAIDSRLSCRRSRNYFEHLWRNDREWGVHFLLRRRHLQLWHPDRGEQRLLGQLR